MSRSRSTQGFAGLAGDRLRVVLVLVVAMGGLFAIAGRASAATFVTAWGSQGSDPGQFNFPKDVAVDAHGHVYVADSGPGHVTGNDRVEKFGADGAFVTAWGTKGSPPGKFFNNPAGIAGDGQGAVCVPHPPNRPIAKCTPAGALLKAWGSRGAGRGQFNEPVGIAVDARGHVYVADAGNR